MDDDYFDDLLDGVGLLQDSSQESLTSAAANLDFCDSSDNDDSLESLQASPTSSLEPYGRETANIQQKHERNGDADSPASADDSVTCETRLQSQVSSEYMSKNAVVEKIEDVFEGILDALLKETGEPSITLKTRTTSTSKAVASMSDLISVSSVTKNRSFSFPGKSLEEAWRFTVIIRILELMHGALRNDIVLSKRDIYYRDPALFGRQALVDRYVDDIAFTFGVSRSMLNVTAVAKGLVTGVIRFCRRDGSIVEVANDREGMLIPIVEKEASFRSIVASAFWSTIATEGVIITGKGYPDIATRALLRFLSTPSPQNGFASPPVYGLVDFDPDGLAILSMYREGSLALSHENAALRVPQMQWLGLRTDHMKLDGGDLHAIQGLLSLTTRDRKKAIKMLERHAAHDNEADTLGIRPALQTMLMLNVKAELQLLDAYPDGMLELLTSKLYGV